MNCILFHNTVYLSKDQKISELTAAGAKQILEGLDRVRICVVDSDVELASAPESDIQKKDSMLARKFAQSHPAHAYVLQDEKIDDNIFQVIGIKESKVSAIYSSIPSSHVDVFIPYAVALRHFLLQRKVDLERGVLFIDDLGESKLLTVFSGNKFSGTRTITHDLDDLLPEIKRSQIGFAKKIEDFDNNKLLDMAIMTNSRLIAQHLSGKDLAGTAEYVDVQYPGLIGLESIQDSPDLMKFRLPGEIKEARAREQLKQQTAYLTISLSILGAGLLFAFVGQIQWGLMKREFKDLSRENSILSKRLEAMDIRTYREDLRQQKFLNYAVAYLKILDILPFSYELDALKFSRDGRWQMQAYLSTKEGQSFDEIPRIGLLKNAVISDFFIKNKPGKRIQIEL